MTDKKQAALDEFIRQATSADRVITAEDEQKLIDAEEILRAALIEAPTGLHKLNMHIVLDILAQAARGEALDPEMCQTVESIAREYNHKDFTADDIQALYDCGSDTSRWQLIETAPKDGSCILGIWWSGDVTHGFPFTCYWNGEKWYSPASCKHDEVHREPSHWKAIKLPERSNADMKEGKCA